MKLAWGNHPRVTPRFRSIALTIASAIRIDASHLMACIKFESDFDPAARNPGSTGTGLIQFMAATAIDLNTTVEALAAMSSEDQLLFVYKYFLPYVGKLQTLSDTYMAILLPTEIGLPEDAVIFPAGSKAMLANRGLDIDHDGEVTKAEAASFVAAALAQGMQTGNVFETDDDAQQAAPTVDGTTSTEGGDMDLGKTLDTGAAIVGMFNPMAGGIMGLAGQLLKAFAPVVQAKVAKEINRHTDDPQVGIDAATALAQMLVGQAQGLTGKADPFDAVAAVRADPVKLQTIEQTTSDQMDAMAKAFDKSGGYDQAFWTAQNVGRQTVSSIAIEERRAGIWDMTKALVYSSEGLTWLVVAGTLTPILVAVCMGKDNVALALLGFAGGIVGTILKTRSQPFDYRFDGTKEASAQTKALIDVANTNNKAAKP